LSNQFYNIGNVTARCEYRRGELTLTLEDDGIGIDEETLPHIYDRFARSKSQKLLGTGLDLPIVQSLVQQMGGTLDIESGKDKGITVWISIPCEAKVIKRRANLNNEL
jgi:signal transduction histidine kinase